MAASEARQGGAVGVTIVLILLAGLLGCVPGDPNEAATQLRVFAAASLRDALTEAAGAWEAREGHPRLEFNFAGSNVLARQLEARPSAADVIVSAHPRWLDELDAESLLVPGSRRALLGNRLVLVAHVDATWTLQRLDQLHLLDFEFLALGHPDAVPAGIYAREALQAVRTESASPNDEASLWQRINGRILPTADVRAALAQVAAQPRIAGIVYRTDAAAARRAGEPVRVLFEIPAELTSPIRYEAAVSSGSRHVDTAGSYLDSLRHGAAAEILRAHGFEVLAD